MSSEEGEITDELSLEDKEHLARKRAIAALQGSILPSTGQTNRWAQLSDSEHEDRDQGQTNSPPKQDNNGASANANLLGADDPAQEVEVVPADNSLSPNEARAPPKLATISKTLSNGGRWGSKRGLLDDNSDEEEDEKRRKKKSKRGQGNDEDATTTNLNSVDIQTDNTSVPTRQSAQQPANSPLRQPGHNDLGDDSEAEDGNSAGERVHDQLLVSSLRGCRSVDCFEKLNHIDEGTYGVVFRAKDKDTGEVFALKQIKMVKEKEGFPITALREVTTLLNLRHPNIVQVREVVIGSTMDKIYMVMEYMEHDLKVLFENMKQPFSQAEVKCLLKQLLSAVAYMHDNWILHRDLKSSNLLFDNKGVLKVCDFGLARKYGSPIKPYTQLVVTLWYRAPELLLGATTYSTAIDMWSVGCLFAEFVTRKPLFATKCELAQIDKIFKTLGVPDEKRWKGLKDLPNAKTIKFSGSPNNRLREHLPSFAHGGGAFLSDQGYDLLNKMLTYDPKERITAQQALEHPYFSESPLAKEPGDMPTFPESQNRSHKRR